VRTPLYQTATQLSAETDSCARRPGTGIAAAGRRSQSLWGSLCTLDAQVTDMSRIIREIENGAISMSWVVEQRGFELRTLRDAFVYVRHLPRSSRTKVVVSETSAVELANAASVFRRSPSRYAPANPARRSGGPSSSGTATIPRRGASQRLPTARGVAGQGALPDSRASRSSRVPAGPANHRSRKRAPFRRSRLPCNFFVPAEP
jgi:hypothetical protein